LDVKYVVPSHELFIPKVYYGQSARNRYFGLLASPNRQAIHILMSHHPAEMVDFKEFEWIIKFGPSSSWCVKPSASEIERLSQPRNCGTEPWEVPKCTSSILTRLDTVKVWAAAPLTTPLDDIVFECTVDGHSQRNDLGPCRSCTAGKSAAVKGTQLVYYLVFETQEHNGVLPFPDSLYKLIKCGSREAAVEQVLLGSGINGWNLVFSCIFRYRECFNDFSGSGIRRVNSLWGLSEDAEDQQMIRVFF
jgi:hypothetical protein